MVTTRTNVNPSSRTIRVSDEVYKKLYSLAMADSKTVAGVIAELIREREDRVFFQQLNEEALRLRADPVAWKEYQDELAEWDVTLLDGLEEE